MNERKKIPQIRFTNFYSEWVCHEFGNVIREYCEKTTSENEDVLLSCSIEGMFLNSELFSHQRGLSNIGYLKIKSGDLILSAQNLHLGNANVNLRFQHGIVSPAYKVYNVIGCTPEFLYVWVKRDSTKNFFLNATTEGASLCRKNIEWNSLYHQAILLPKETEQKQIAKFFINLEQIISRKESQKQKIQALKASMLEKMFPKDGANVPEIRFKGFTGAWKRSKAADIAEYSKGRFYSKADLTDTGTQVILYGRLYTKYQFIIDEVDTFVKSKSGSVYSQGNEVIIPASGETVDDIARASAIEGSGILIGGDLNILRPFKFIKPSFLALSISNSESKKELSQKAQGKTIVHIHNSDIQEISISYPTIEEQDKIVTFFRRLDNSIALHQQELEKLQSIKKALLEKMFV